MSEAEVKARGQLLAFARTLGIHTAEDIGKALKAMGFNRKFQARDLNECQNLLRQWQVQKDKKEEEDKLTGRREEIRRMVDRGLEYRPHKVRDWNVLKHQFVKYQTKEEREADERKQ